VDRTDGGTVRDEKMPELVLNGGALFERWGVDVNLFGNYIGPYRNDRFLDRRWVLQHGPMPLGDFLSVDFSAGYTFGGDVSTRIFVEVRNLLDRAYLTVPGYPDPGRVIMTGLGVRVG
jgi:outer membrane receptor protein involved in Fe transport